MIIKARDPIHVAVVRSSRGGGNHEKVFFFFFKGALLLCPTKHDTSRLVVVAGKTRMNNEKKKNGFHEGFRNFLSSCFFSCFWNNRQQVGSAVFVRVVN